MAKVLICLELAVPAAPWASLTPCQSSPTSQTHIAFGTPRLRSCNSPLGLPGPWSASRLPVSRVGTVPLPIGTALIFLQVDWPSLLSVMYFNELFILLDVDPKDFLS